MLFRSVDAVESGQLSKDELDAKCRKVLMYKYMLGLRNRQPQLRVSGMSYRINTEEAQALAAKLRRSAVTVLNNYFDVLMRGSITISYLASGTSVWKLLCTATRPDMTMGLK